MIDHEARRLTIGGSEVGAIFECDESRSAFDVWARKKGGLVEAPGDKPMRMVVGKALEQGVLSLYTYVTGRAVTYCDVTSVSPVRPWMAYTPDAFCNDEKRGVDAKVVFWDQKHKWGPSVDEIPDRVRLQAYWYMAALDYDRWDICALIGEGEPRVYEIERPDGATEKQMLERTREWHARYLVGDDIPPIVPSHYGREWLKVAFPKDNARMKEATDADLALLDEYAGVRSKLSEYGDRREELENLLKQALGEYQGIEFAAGRFTWKNTAGEQTEWKKLAQSLLANHVAEEETRKRLLAEYTMPKPGRRIYFKHDHADLRAA